MIRTSHVGSFPLDYSRENVEMILKDLYTIGLDAPPYPQLRSFIDIYLEPLLKANIISYSRGFYFSKPKDLEESSLPTPTIQEAIDTINYLKRANVKFKWLRAPVTGPFTLASRIYVEEDISKGLNSTLLKHKEILFNKIVPYIKSFIRFLLNLGFNIIFVDEPVLGVIVGKRRILLGYSSNDIREVISSLFTNVGGEHGIHVCGHISNKLFEILASIDELNILNFEFYDSRRNLNVIDKKLLEKYDKFLAPGVASAKKPSIETVDDIKKLLNIINNLVDGRIDLVSADCGFGGLKDALNNNIEAYRIGINKLKNIVYVVKKYYST